MSVAKDEYRRDPVANQSARCLAAYLYCAAGSGESTTDLTPAEHGRRALGEVGGHKYRLDPHGVHHASTGRLPEVPSIGPEARTVSRSP